METSTSQGAHQESNILADRLRRIDGLLQTGDFRAAIEQGHALLDLCPADRDALRYLGLGYLKLENWAEAGRYLSQALRAGAESPHLLNEIGIVRMKQAAYTEAESYFSRALGLDPLHSDALNNMAALYTVQRLPQKAGGYLDRLLRVLPSSARTHVQVATNSLRLNDVEKAIRHAHQAVALAPQSASARLSLAEALEIGGQFAEAESQYLAVLSRTPEHVAALSRLLALQSTRVGGEHELRAQKLLDERTLSEEDQILLRLALAQYSDRRREFDRAFEYLRSANSAKFKKRPFDSAQHSRIVDRLIDVYRTEFFDSLRARAVRSRRPLFILGMPRSGTTLVEQILASHSRVAAGGELSTLANIAGQLNQPGRSYPECMRDLDEATLTRCANRYLERLHAISSDTDKVTDKMPFNFLHVGLIATLFPDATIVHCRRDPLDTCVSCYFTTFSELHPFADDLRALGRYYLDYSRLMTHWQNVLPVPPYSLRYEQLIADPEPAIRELLDFCGLDWETGCMEFHRAAGNVRTPSRWQVRQPLYTRSVGRWRHYERHLNPLRDAMQSPIQEQDSHVSAQ
jgi:tetratricopeptide (TPR) repeat protein